MYHNRTYNNKINRLHGRHLHLTYNYKYSSFEERWMCHDRTYNNKIKRLHERQLHLIYNYKCLSFEDLLVKDKTVSIYHKNIHALAMFKVYTKSSPKIMQEVFQVKV